MELKAGRNTYELNKNDVVLYNGAAYILITRKERVGWSESSPTVAKVRMEKLIKEGKFKEVRFKNPPYKDEFMKYYKITQ
ncbi:hypothetical protein P4571_08075 [Niallia alba]|uniref:hypothetical protein n=1 Tax=Niallia alba TaxID=2729105 RepID=UPI002E24ED16|nr:hypothetical protein [Niallia alba]